MPSFCSPDYVHLRMPTNESQMQLMAMQEGHDTPSSSPCFNGPPPPDYAETAPPPLPRIAYKGARRCWTGRTQLERALLAVVFLLLLLCALLLLLLIVRSDAATEREDSYEGSSDFALSHATAKPPVCVSRGCVKAANNLIQAMNVSVDPCSNFYEFACGQWNRDHPIPDDMFAYGTFAFVREQVRQQLRVLLESSAPSNSRSIQMARIAYKTCMNTEQLEQLKTSLLLESLEGVGGWPLLSPSSFHADNFSISSLLAKTRRFHGSDVFFQIYVYADAKNTTQNTLFIDQGTLGLGRGTRDYFLNETMFANQIAAYKKYMKEVVQILLSDANLTRTDEEINADIAALLAFERRFAKVVVPEDDRRNNTRLYNKRRLKDLYELLPQVDWIDYFHIIAPDSLHEHLRNDTPIVVCEVEFLKEVSRLLNETDSRTLANYVVWRVIQGHLRYLDDRFEDIKTDFMRVMTGQQQRSPRWKECAQIPSNVLPLAAGAIYIREHFDSTDKKEALEMIGHLRDAFVDLVRTNDWMDEATKRVAEEKAKNMIKNIGYPDLIQNVTALDQQYEKLEISEFDTYFGMMQKAVAWMHEKDFLKLLKPFDRYDFDVSPAVVNAFYSPERNALTFPAGILQPPFFSGAFPKAVNYGAIGAVIGHEITHGFDDQGSQYDKDGNLENWWNADSLKGFDERKECIIAQYSNYSVPDTHFKVNGKLTQGENIADNGGVKEAYRAYRKYVEGQKGGEEERLPGLQNFSNDQIFFLSYAHFWCGHKKEAAAVQQVLTDEHSPELFRVMGVLSNLREFADAFKCSVGSSLNPEKKCVVW